MIGAGVVPDIKKMLSEQAGYSEQQLTYVVLLRQQLDNSKRAGDKLKRDIIELRDRVSAAERKLLNAESEAELLRLELKQAEHRNVSLKR